MSDLRDPSLRFVLLCAMVCAKCLSSETVEDDDIFISDGDFCNTLGDSPRDALEAPPPPHALFRAPSLRSHCLPGSKCQLP